MPTSGPWQGHSQIVFSVPLCRCFRIKHTGCIHARARTCGRTCAGVGVSVLACLRALLRAGTTACTHARLHPHAHTPVRASPHVRSCAGVPVRARECTCTNVCLRVGMSMSENVLTRACAHVCMCVCLCKCVCLLSRANGTQMTTSNLACKPKGKRKNTKNRGQLNSNPGWPAKAPFESIRTVTWVRRLLQPSGASVYNCRSLSRTTRKQIGMVANACWS